MSIKLQNWTKRNGIHQINLILLLNLSNGSVGHPHVFIFFWLLGDEQLSPLNICFKWIGFTIKNRICKLFVWRFWWKALFIFIICYFLFLIFWDIVWSTVCIKTLQVWQISISISEDYDYQINKYLWVNFIIRRYVDK